MFLKIPGQMFHYILHYNCIYKPSIVIFCLIIRKSSNKMGRDLEAGHIQFRYFDMILSFWQEISYFGFDADEKSTNSLWNLVKIVNFLLKHISGSIAIFWWACCGFFDILLFDGLSNYIQNLELWMTLP